MSPDTLGGKWSLGHIIKVHPEQDGKVSVVDRRRLVVKLSPLEHCDKTMNSLNLLRDIEVVFFRGTLLQELYSIELLFTIVLYLGDIVTLRKGECLEGLGTSYIMEMRNKFF